MSTDTALSEQARTLFTMRLSSAIASRSLASQNFLHLLQAMREKAESADVVNWDGQGALSVEASTVRYATCLLQSIAQLHALPEIDIDRDGEIVFDWDSGPNRRFSVAVGRDGTLTYVGRFGSARVRGVELLHSGFPAAVMVGVERAVAPQNGFVAA